MGYDKRGDTKKNTSCVPISFFYSLPEFSLREYKVKYGATLLLMQIYNTQNTEKAVFSNVTYLLKLNGNS